LDSGEYPTAEEVGILAVALNPERTQSYFEEMIKQLQRETGEFARAVCHNRENGQRHVYFPSGIEPPEDADEVHCNGEQYEPALFPESKHNDSDEDGQSLVTDGGTDFKSPSVLVVWPERENRSKSGSSLSMVLTTTLLMQNLPNDSVLLDVG
jgi:hypothetical protein